MALLRVSLPLLVAPLLAGPLLACATVARTAPATPIAGDPAPATVYARMNAAIADVGGLHAILTTETTEAPHPYTTTQELWLDGLGRGRTETATTFLLTPPVLRRATSIVLGDEATVLLDAAPRMTHQALACRDAPDAALALLFGCRGFLETSQTLVQEGTSYSGTAATAIITRGVAQGRGAKTWFEDTLYVDRLTWLPIALETAAVIDDGQQHDLRTTTTYRYGRFDEATAPALFDATALAGPTQAPVAALGDLAAGVPWPRRIDAAGATLVLASTFVASTDNGAWLPYRAELAYRPAHDAFAAADIVLQLMPAGALMTEGDVFVDAPPGRIVVRATAPAAASRPRIEATAAALLALLRP